MAVRCKVGTGARGVGARVDIPAVDPISMESPRVSPAVRPVSLNEHARLARLEGTRIPIRVCGEIPREPCLRLWVVIRRPRALRRRGDSLEGLDQPLRRLALAQFLIYSIRCPPEVTGSCLNESRSAGGRADDCDRRYAGVGCGANVGAVIVKVGVLVEGGLSEAAQDETWS